jgi:PPOX class probable F420-dependent enzyme
MSAAPTSVMSDAEARRMLGEARVGRMATSDPEGRPHLVPVVFALAGDRIFLPIDHKPKRSSSPESLRRVRNLRANPRASLLVDRYDEDWSRLAWARGDGPVDLVEEGPEFREGVARLTEKYPQYRAHPLPAEGATLMIVLHVAALRGWRSS